MKYLLILISLVICVSKLSAQANDTFRYPKVGEAMPNLSISNIKYYSKDHVLTSEFKGKWFLLEFWDINCGACIASFPTTNEIQRRLGDSVQVMLLGIQDAKGLIEPMYAKFREREHLIMPCAFDSALANRLNISAVPRSILIDNRGVVRCMTSSLNLEDIKGFLAGNPPVMLSGHSYQTPEIKNETERHYEFDRTKPFLINGNGGDDTVFLFRSILATWNHNLNRQYVPLTISENIVNGKFQVLGVPLEWLYNYAYFGQSDWDFHDTTHYAKDYMHPVLELHDSSRFKYSYKYSQNIYSYSLTMPADQCTEYSVENAIRRELETFFNFEAKIEKRDCPCWKLVANEMARKNLKTKMKTPYYEQSVYRAGFKAGDFPFAKLVDWIKSNQPDKVIIDQTRIYENVDISMDCIPTDFADLQNALHQNGLDLIPSKIPMQVLVIRDKDRNITMK